MLRNVALACILVLVAGCSSGGSPEANPHPVPTSSSQSETTNVQPIPLTDTLYFLDAPHMSGTLTQQELRVPLKPVNVANPESSIVRWTLPRPEDLVRLDVQVHLWIEVTGTYPNADPSGGECFWSASISVAGSDASNYLVLCAAEGPVVQQGIREVTFSGQTSIADLDGDEIEIAVVMSAPETPGATAHLLAGTDEFPSLVTIVGLQLPLDTQTLLLSH